LAWEATKIATRIPQVLSSRAYDVTWLNRQLYPRIPTFEFAINKPMILDVDDAIWLKRPLGTFQAKLNAKMAEVIIAGNSFIADWFSRYNSNIHVIPTAVDTTKFCPKKLDPKVEKTKFVIGWVGTHSNLKYLYSIEEALTRFCKDHSDAQILVACDKRPRFSSVPQRQLRFIQWSDANEAYLIQEMDVGLMPLFDDDWCRGKCSMKMLQYMACGVPVVVSPVGMNKTVLKMDDIGLAARNDNDWLETLETYYSDKTTLRKLHGANGRKIIENEFSAAIIAKRLAAIFHSIT